MHPSTHRSAFSRSLSGLTLALLATLAAALAPGIHAARAQGTSIAESAESRPAAAERQVFALYYYDFQGDRRKAVPYQGIRDAQGLTTLTDHPWESVGPWMSFDRAQWHKNQFQMMAAGGIDVALAVYRGDAASRRAYAIKGLDVMTEALKELRSAGLAPFTIAREYPQIGMALDLSSLATHYGGPVSLKDPDVQRSLYGMVRDFYTHVPEEFRASVQLPAAHRTAVPKLGNSSSPNGIAYVVRLFGDAAVKDADGSFMAYANRRFAEEFGARLAWIGTPALQAHGATCDAVAPFPAAGQPATVNTEGWLRTGSLGPGYDSGSSNREVAIRPRDNGRTTLEDFQTINNAGPEWVLIDSWNGYAQGTDIAPTFEHGLLYRDLTRVNVLRYKQTADYSCHIVKAAVPRYIEPGRIYQIDIAIQNTGNTDWDVFNSAAPSSRWLKNGEPVGDTPTRASITGQVRGDTKTYLLGVAAPIKTGKPLPPGEYELEINMARRVGDEDVWFDLNDSAPYRVPITVGPAPEGRPYWINSTLTTLAKRGAEYPAQIRVRNDGHDTWKKGAASVGYRWHKVSTYLKGTSVDSDVVVAEGKRIPLEADVAPGRLVTVDARVATTDAAGAPLPTWSAQDDWVYVLEWDLYDGQKYLSTVGGATYREPVEVLDRDPGASFLGCDLSNQLVAGRTEKVRVGLVNQGPEKWVKDRDKIVVHWYYMDGTEAAWNDDTLPLPEDVPPFSLEAVQAPADSVLRLPGEPEKKEKKKKGPEEKTRTEMAVHPIILRDVPVHVPFYFGPMYCVFDFQHDGLHASTGPASKDNDILVIPVNVFSPTFTLVPLNEQFDTDGISQDIDRGDGDLDGRGNTLPAEFVPPFVARPAVGPGPVSSPVYPSGLWARPLNDLRGTRACFIFPSKNNQSPNMTACTGKVIPLSPFQRSAVHLMALSTEEEVTAEFVLTYGDGTAVKKKVAFTHWNDPPRHGEKIAFTTPHRHTRAGDDPVTRCYVNQYTLETDTTKTLVSITLPQQPAVKILAITLESSQVKIN